MSAADCTAWLCYAELFVGFPAFSGWFQLLLPFLPEDHVGSPLQSPTLGFAGIRRERNPMKSNSGERRTRLLGLPESYGLLAYRSPPSHFRGPGV
jgi:hypothetical protein